jgi:anaerobic selenocysteine-containing dehydrogenase
MAHDESRTSYITCPLCEATCGLEVVSSGPEVISIRGNKNDVFSRGYICPKAYALKELHSDPDRVRAPMIRTGETWREVTWDEAFGEIERRLTPILTEHGRDSVAVYLGNPTIHNLSGQLYNSVLLRALSSVNIYTASTVDQMPKQVSCGLMFGHFLSIPIPDVDNTDYLLILGANPLVSNGSLLTAPDMRGRLRRIKERGGKVVVIDPRRTRTALEASEHHFIQPGTDPWLLLGIVHSLFDEGLVHPGRLQEHLNGVETVRVLAQEYSPEVVAPICRVAPETIRQLARDLAGADRAAVYGRIGTCTQEYGTITSWLVDVLNVLTGNLDHEGGVLFPKAAAGSRNATGVPGTGRGMRLGGKKSRVRGASQVAGELPVAVLAEEITTPGAGQIRALITVAGNPALSTPESERLDTALDTLDFMISVDGYLNETTRHADVLLPPPTPLQRSHYDLAFYQLSTRNIAHYSHPIFALEPGQQEEWKTLLRLTGIVAGQGVSADIAALDDFVAYQVVSREVGMAGSRVEGRDAGELLAALQPSRGPERLLDFLLRVGPYGDAFGAQPGGLTLAAIEDNPDGLDLGPLQPRIPEVLRTPSGKIELAPEPIVADLDRLRRGMSRSVPAMVLIGRRELRSNNSWMHNVPALMKGDDPCTLLLHPDDATRLGLADGDRARISSSASSVEAPVQITRDIMSGVVSLPHGWGHDQPGTRMSVANARHGVNINRLMSNLAIDPLSGNAALNAIPVKITLTQRSQPIAAIPLAD